MQNAASDEVGECALPGSRTSANCLVRILRNGSTSLRNADTEKWGTARLVDVQKSLLRAAAFRYSMSSRNLIGRTISRMPLRALQHDPPGIRDAPVSDGGRYRAEITAGGLKLRESRIVAGLLLTGLNRDTWTSAIRDKNVLQARSAETAIRLGRLVRQRLETMDSDLWRLVRDGNKTVATHAVLAATIKYSPLVGDFLDMVVREQFRLFASKLSKALWEEYLTGCRARDPEMPAWNESTRRRLRSSVFQTLTQAGFLNNTRALQLQPVRIAPEVIGYLENHEEDYVLRRIQVSP